MYIVKYSLKKCFTYSVVSHFKITPLVNEANNTSFVNHTRFENNMLPTLIFHTISPDGTFHTIISPLPAENKYLKMMQTKLYRQNMKYCRIDQFFLLKMKIVQRYKILHL